MLGDEANVAMIARMKSTEGNVLERVKVVDARTSLLALLLQVKVIRISTHFHFQKLTFDRSTIRNP